MHIYKCIYIIKNLPAKSALQKTFLPCKIENKKCIKNYEAATKGSLHIIHHYICFFFLSIWVFFHEPSQFTGQYEKGRPSV